MLKFRLEKYAAQESKKRGEYYGLSIYPDAQGYDAWFVGQKEELIKVGVPADKIKKAD